MNYLMDLVWASTGIFLGGLVFVSLLRWGLEAAPNPPQAQSVDIITMVVSHLIGIALMLWVVTCLNLDALEAETRRWGPVVGIGVLLGCGVARVFMVGSRAFCAKIRGISAR